MSRTRFNVCFELKGKSLEAALKLQSIVEEEAKRAKPQTQGYLNEIEDSWDGFYQNLVTRLKQEDPELLKATGLMTPVVCVYKAKDAHPRAYEKFPHIFSTWTKNPRYFMYADVDYKGDYFKPEDAEELDAEKAQIVGNGLFAGGWVGNPPLLSLKEKGVATPSDYKPKDYAPDETGLSEEFRTVTTRTRRNFVAAGKSLEIIADFKRRENEHREAVNALQDALKQAVEKQFPEMLKSLPEGEELYINTSSGTGGSLGRKTKIDMSVRQAGKVDIMMGGQPIDIQANPYFKFYKLSNNGGDYTIRPKRSTPEGREIAKLFDAIPPVPHLHDYPELHADFYFEPKGIEKFIGINGVVPVVWDVGGMKILSYSSDESVKSDFCPPDSLPISNATFEWLKADQEDKNVGKTPPPMPAAVWHELCATASIQAGTDATLNSKPPKPS